ncbi:uncharacterized protein LOC105189072 [Harpegnathos saltator]|uniref:uncharacterized protein LOC105189072 n=1 Tax=Harpegnathos saltator TaxID=610380 RepID=UPI00058DC006|nr:uncharacterized protein LOC105189072 [Harpegnathos saltator]XP_025162935.1 uncharacterized protein LOC105189072 [Harpegnathos saltator]XP_025162937.1 uncharacterized protein LOC105189072 [Harpegnathos saltator]
MVQCCVCRKEHCPLLPRQFHSFPRDEERREKWLNSIGCVVTAKQARICSDHFTDDDYYDTGTPVQSRRLKKTAIPSVFMQGVSKNVHKDSTSNIKSENQHNILIKMEHGYTMDMDMNIESTVNIEQQLDVQQSITYIEKDNIRNKTIIAKSINTTDTSRISKQKNTSNIAKIFIRTGKYNLECMRKTDFITNEAWMKFIKYIKYNRYVQKCGVAQKSRTQKKLVTMKSIIQALQSKNLEIHDIINTLKKCYDNIVRVDHQQAADNKPNSPREQANC